MLGTKADMIMPGVWEFKAERKLTDAERKQEFDNLIALLDQKIADYQNFRGMQCETREAPDARTEKCH